MIYLLDTDTLTHLWHGRSSVVEQIRRLDRMDRFAIAIITRIETLRGRFDAVLKAADAAAIRAAQDHLAESERLLAELTIEPFDGRAAARFERLSKTKGLRKIGRADLLIASIALALNATLVTRNLRHFGVVPDLRVVNGVE